MGRFVEWEHLCAKYESAQDENTTAYLAITAKLFLGGGTDARTSRPSAAEIARWDTARRRLTDIDARMRRFVQEIVDAQDPGSPRPSGDDDPRWH